MTFINGGMRIGGISAGGRSAETWPCLAHSFESRFGYQNGAMESYSQRQAGEC
jgi:hypothetical protein